MIGERRSQDRNPFGFLIDPLGNLFDSFKALLRQVVYQRGFKHLKEQHEDQKNRNRNNKGKT